MVIGSDQASDKGFNRALKLKTGDFYQLPPSNPPQCGPEEMTSQLLVQTFKCLVGISTRRSVAHPVQVGPAPNCKIPLPSLFPAGYGTSPVACFQPGFLISHRYDTSTVMDATGKSEHNCINLLPLRKAMVSKTRNGFVGRGYVLFCHSLPQSCLNGEVRDDGAHFFRCALCSQG